MFAKIRYAIASVIYRAATKLAPKPNVVGPWPPKQ